MIEDKRKLCLNCAWRAKCFERFFMDSTGTLFCPDYSEDVTLDNVKTGQDEPEVKKD